MIGRVYKLVCRVTGLVYVGSTTKTLERRLAGHHSQYKEWQDGKKNYITSCKVIENGNFDILLLEEVECESKEELHARERYYIEILEGCVNKCVPTRSKKEHYRANADTLRVKSRCYRLANLEQAQKRERAYKVAKVEAISNPLGYSVVVVQSSDMGTQLGIKEV